MKTKTILTALAIFNLPALAGPPSPVVPMPPPVADSGWQFRFAPYLWAQGLDGASGVRGLEGDVNVDFSDIVSDLDFAFMGTFEARRGRWGILTDVNYAELSDSFDTRGIIFSGGDFKMKQFLSNITLNYRVMENAGTVIDLYAGARLNWIDLNLELEGGKGGSVSRSGDDFWADAIVGARFQTDLGGRWFFRATGDIGAGQSDFTWQAVGLIGYKINDNCNVGLGYRGLGTDYKNGGFTYDITAHGPVLGVEWRW
jgi:hypothetical protein